MRVEVLRSIALESERIRHRARADGEDFKRGFRVYKLITYEAGDTKGKEDTWRDVSVALRVLIKFRATE